MSAHGQVEDDSIMQRDARIVGIDRRPDEAMNRARVVAEPRLRELEEKRQVGVPVVAAHDTTHRGGRFQGRRIDPHRRALTKPAPVSRCKSQVKAASCVLTSSRRRVREMVE